MSEEETKVTYDPYYKKKQYAYKIINSALLQYDLESLSENYRINHKSFNCIKGDNPLMVCTDYDKDLKWIDIYLPLDKPDYCIKHTAIHEIAHIIEFVKKGISYDSLSFRHSKTFYNICIAIDPNYLKLESCDLCLWILQLLVCNKIEKGFKKMEVIKEEKKKIKCPLCNKTFNKTDLLIRIETTDRYIGMDWGVRSWEEDVIGMCPNCRHPLMINNKKIEYRFIKNLQKAKDLWSITGMDNTI